MTVDPGSSRQPGYRVRGGVPKEQPRNRVNLGRRARWTGIPAGLLALVGIWQRTPGGYALAAIAVSLMVTYLGAGAVRGLTRMQAEDGVLHIRRLVRRVGVRAADVRGVRFQFNGRNPDFRLIRATGQAVVVPTSRFDDGPEYLFTWLAIHAPGAELDQRSQTFRSALGGF